MNPRILKKLILPSLRGKIGDWIYYSSLMSMREIGERVNYADELHNNKKLSDMMQRSLEDSRSEAIAKYIKLEKERFFNSIVIATHRGSPLWYELDLDASKIESSKMQVLKESEIMGFMELSGQESLFTIDGQHRLSGIKELLKNEKESNVMHRELDELVSVIFVAHKNNEEGRKRSRKLFTTLNKMAKPVNKKNIIALDEDDVMAITTRYLIEDTDIFPGSRIDFSGAANISRDNINSLTTIINLYDVLSILFSYSNFPQRKALSNLKAYRPTDKVLDEYFYYAETFFRDIGKQFPEIKEFLSSGDEPSSVVEKYRGAHGGSVLFRPRGLTEFARMISLLTKDMTLKNSIKFVAKLPTDISKPPYLNLIWDSSDGSIISKNFTFMREILLDMLGGKSQYSNKGNKLRDEYREKIGNPKAQLPKRVA